jgi:RNA polymerase sigma factor (sigma-70 family)
MPWHVVIYLKADRYAFKGMVADTLEMSKELTSNDIGGDCEKSMVKVAGGDISALSQLYGCLKKPVFLLAYSIVGNYPLAEDITQETFLRVNDKASLYRTGTNPKAWIFTIARNLSLSAVRSRGREELSDDEPPQAGTDLEDIAVYDADFTRAISVLDNDERNIVILKIAASLKHREISKIMGISVGDTRVRYFRALKKLKNYYGDKGAK